SLQEWSESDASSEESSELPEREGNTSRTLCDMDDIYERAKDCVYPNNEICSYMPGSPTGKPCTLRSHFHITLPHQLILDCRYRYMLRKSRLPKMPPYEPPRPTTVIGMKARVPGLFDRMSHTYHHCSRRDKIYTKPAGPLLLDNFAISYLQFLKHRVWGLLELKLPNTMDELYLMREIIFMFIKPNNCRFFEVNKETHDIWVRPNFTICTSTVVRGVNFSPSFLGVLITDLPLQETVQHLLSTELIRPMRDMWKLRYVLAQNLTFLGYGSRGTLGCFLYGVRDLLDPMSVALNEYETYLQRSPEKASLLHFIHKMRPHFALLSILRRLTDDVVLEQGPNYVRSAYLLSKLYRHTMPCMEHQKLATALLIITLKRYCNIIDAWWTRGSLEDFLSEFIVESCIDERDYENTCTVRRRSLSPSESPETHKIFEKVLTCPFYCLLLQHALDSGDSQELLRRVNLLGEMLSASNVGKESSLHDEFAKQLFEQTKLYCPNMPTEDEVPATSTTSDRIVECHRREVHGAGHLANKNLTYLLNGAFRERTEELTRRQGRRKPLTGPNLLRRLQIGTTLHVRVELPEALRVILLRRHMLANEYAMRAYRKELRLDGHLHFLRHTMLLEGYCHVMPFYLSIFKRIETGQFWHDIADLSTDLRRIQVAHYPDFACSFWLYASSQVKCRSSKAFEALDGLEVKYNITPSLQRIIRRRHMQVYNKVWHLMLKLKWALWKLENMSFIQRPKWDPYSPMDLADLTVRRLEILRFWLLYLIHSLHTHVMQCVVQRIESRLDECTNIREQKKLLDEYVNDLKSYCLLTEEFTSFRVALDQLFHLVYVMDLEWDSCRSCLSDEDNALALDISRPNESGDMTSVKKMEYLALNQVVEIEMTYIRCHQTLAEILNTLAYKENHGF
ncbi:hypothetical protein KR018_009237, partial [Drosophila ironensis]